MGNNNDAKKRPNKVVALVTYIIALIALLLGLFLPWGTDPALNGTKDAIWAFQLPDALSRAVPIEALVNLLKDAEGNIVGAPFAFSLPITFNGALENGYDLGALATVLYALVVLLGVAALVPAIVSTFSKKSKTNIALNAASFIEVLAFLFVSIFVFIQLTTFTMLGQVTSALSDGATAETTYQWSWPLLGAFGGTFVMLVIQSIVYKKGSGVFKFVLLLLSTLALMLVVYDLGAVIPPIKEPLDGLVGKTNNLFDGRIYYSAALDYSVIGILPVLMLFGVKLFGVVSLPTLTAAMEGMSAIEQTLLICAFIVSLLTLINFLLDAMGLGKTTKRYMLICNIVRYSLTVVAAALVVVLPFCVEGPITGLMSLVILALAIVSLVLNIIRLVRFNRKGSKVNKAVAAEFNALKQSETAAQTAAQTAQAEEEEKPFVYTPPVFGKEAVKEESKDEPEVYNPVIYNGPTDEFINTLSTEQKIEFSRVFLERQNGNINFIPDYVVGGKNDKFFVSALVYISRLRDFVSTGIFNKMYQYFKMM